MKIEETNIPDVKLIHLDVFGDKRGFFEETYQRKKYAQAGIDVDFVQDNHSGSHQWVLRGLHYQIHHPQGKLIQAVVGRIFDVAVDLRKKSPSFGMWVGKILDAENHDQLWIPPGFAHGFLVLSDWADVTYKATDYYTPGSERTLLWDDPQIGINWPVENKGQLVFSPKDLLGVSLMRAEIFDDL